MPSTNPVYATISIDVGAGHCACPDVIPEGKWAATGGRPYQSEFL